VAAAGRLSTCRSGMSKVVPGMAEIPSGIADLMDLIPELSPLCAVLSHSMLMSLIEALLYSSQRFTGGQITYQTAP
jgi:hypothetical protein